MSLGGYADGVNDVGKLGLEREIWLDFWWIFDPAVWLEHIIRTDSWCGPCKTDLPPPIYLVLKYNKLQFTKILKLKKHVFKPFLVLF